MRGRFRGGGSVGSVGVLMAGLAAGLGGCGTDSFAPPPPEGLRSVLAPAPPQGTGTNKAVTGAKPIELIQAPRDLEAAAASGHFARTQAGYDGVLVHPAVVTEETTPAGQADLVESAIKEKPPVLIVEAPEKPDPRLPKLVDQARGQGIPVVLIGPALAGTDSTESKGSAAKLAPLVRIDSVGFEPTAKQLVASALRVAKNAGLDPKGGAILYFYPNSDPYMPKRVSAIRAALNDAGITTQTAVISDPKSSEAVKSLKSAIEKDPKAVLIFPFEYRSFMATLTATNELLDKRTFVVAGYNSEEKSTFLSQIKNMAAVAEFRPAKLIRRGVQVARSLMRGESVDSSMELPIEFTDSAPRTGVPEPKPAKPQLKSDLEIDDAE